MLPQGNKLPAQATIPRGRQRSGNARRLGVGYKIARRGSRAQWRASGLKTMKLILLIGLWVLQGAGLANSADRIVFLGDSITDGQTYQLLLRQALREAGRPVPVALNAGIGGDTAQGMRVRLERDVVACQPTLAALSAGINDALRGVGVDDFQAAVTAIADRLDAAGIPVLVFTTTIVGPKHAAHQARLGQFNAFLRKLAAARGYRLAEMNTTMRAAADRGEAVLEADEIHISFAGYRVMARELLDALGHSDVAVPAELNLQPLPGLVREWRIRPLKPEPGEWRPLRLPEAEPQAQWWWEHERQRGFALSVQDSHEAKATIESTTARRMWLNLGAHVEKVTLNGDPVYASAGWAGWHAGKGRVAVELHAGKNPLVIETSGPFVVNLTDDDDW